MQSTQQSRPKESLRGLTLQGFIGSVKQNVEHDQEVQIKRFVQKGMFAELWRRATEGDEVRVQKIFSTVGLMTVHLEKEIKALTRSKKNKEAAKPIYGLIRSRVGYHDDIRFVITSVGDYTYLMMDNAAMDSKMATVMKYDLVENMFVNHDMGLLDFILANDVRI